MKSRNLLQCVQKNILLKCTFIFRILQYIKNILMVKEIKNFFINTNIVDWSKGLFNGFFPFHLKNRLPYPHPLYNHCVLSIELSEKEIAQKKVWLIQIIKSFAIPQKENAPCSQAIWVISFVSFICFAWWVHWHFPNSFCDTSRHRHHHQFLLYTHFCPSPNQRPWFHDIFHWSFLLKKKKKNLHRSL